MSTENNNTDELVTVKKTNDPITAQIYKSKLESEGIAVYISNEYTTQLYPGIIFDIEIQVAETDAQKASEIIND